MSIYENGKKTVWVYAVILFTSAFIVLLISAYSQLKYNKSLADYQSKISNGDQEKSTYQYTLSSLLAEHTKVSEELKALKIQSQLDKQIIDNKEKEMAALKGRDSSTRNAYEALLMAEQEYHKGNKIKCALLLNNGYDYSLLGEQAQSRFKYFSEKTFDQAAEQTYKEGYRAYINKKYQDAVDKLTLSMSLRPYGYYADDCHYYIAYARYRMGDNDAAKKEIEILLNRYSNTGYKKDAMDLLKMLG